MSVGDTRRSSMSSATSSPVIAAPCSRKPFSSAFVAGRSWREIVLSAAGSSMGSTSASPACPSARSAAASARSGPTIAALVTRNSTASSRHRSGGAADDARAKSTSAVVPSGCSSTFAARRPPCAIRVACSRPRFAHASSRTASVTSSGASSVERGPVGFAQHEERGVVGPADPCDHDLAHRHAGPLREQEQIRAMFELLVARERERDPGVLVPDRTPRLREQPRVGRVAADHVDGDGAAVGRARDEARLTPQLLRPRDRGPTR